MEICYFESFSKKGTKNTHKWLKMFPIYPAEGERERERELCPCWGRMRRDEVHLKYLVDTGHDLAASPSTYTHTPCHPIPSHPIPFHPMQSSVYPSIFILRSSSGNCYKIYLFIHNLLLFGFCVDFPLCVCVCVCVPRLVHNVQHPSVSYTDHLIT